MMPKAPKIFGFKYGCAEIHALVCPPALEDDAQEAFERYASNIADPAKAIAASHQAPVYYSNLSQENLEQQHVSADCFHPSDVKQGVIAEPVLNNAVLLDSQLHPDI